jgi:hypothetical protein
LSESFSRNEIIGGRIISQHFVRLYDLLKEQGKINPNHIKHMRKFDTVIKSANQSFVHINDYDKIVRGKEDRKKFLKKNSDISNDMLDEIWFDLYINATLRWYWVIEISLITMLKDVQYGRKGVIEGKETLGKLKDVLTSLGVSKHIEWDLLDITFRNALAHGWYYRKTQRIVYFKNSQLKKGKGKLLNRSEFIQKCRNLHLYGLIIVAVVGAWKNIEDEGFSEPIRKKKRR